MDQQEGEYETELQQLTAAANAGINSERENIGKLRAILQVAKSYGLLNVLPNNKGVGVTVTFIANHTQPVGSGKVVPPSLFPTPANPTLFFEITYAIFKTTEKCRGRSRRDARYTRKCL